MGVAHVGADACGFAAVLLDLGDEVFVVGGVAGEKNDGVSATKGVVSVSGYRRMKGGGVRAESLLRSELPGHSGAGAGTDAGDDGERRVGRGHSGNGGAEVLAEAGQADTGGCELW